MPLPLKLKGGEEEGRGEARRRKEGKENREGVEEDRGRRRRRKCRYRRWRWRWLHEFKFGVFIRNHNEKLYMYECMCAHIYVGYLASGYWFPKYFLPITRVSSVCGQEMYKWAWNILLQNAEKNIVSGLKRLALTQFGTIWISKRIMIVINLPHWILKNLNS